MCKLAWLCGLPTRTLKTLAGEVAKTLDLCTNLHTTHMDSV